MGQDLWAGLLTAFVLAASLGFLVGDRIRRLIERVLGLSGRGDWLWAWRQGYRVGAGHRAFRRQVAAWCFLIGSLLCFAAGAGFLWAAADVFARQTVGEPAKTVVIGKYKAWNRLYRADALGGRPAR